MEKSKPVVVGIGELLWDVFPDVKKAGGAPINFVYHATQLGGRLCDQCRGQRRVRNRDYSGIG